MAGTADLVIERVQYPSPPINDMPLFWVRHTFDKHTSQTTEHLIVSAEKNGLLIQLFGNRILDEGPRNGKLWQERAEEKGQNEFQLVDAECVSIY